jgi:hypothetical protein
MCQASAKPVSILTWLASHRIGVMGMHLSKGEYIATYFLRMSEGLEGIKLAH